MGADAVNLDFDESRFHPSTFFDLRNSHARALFEGVDYVWEGVAAIPEYINRVFEPKILGEVEEGAWLEPGKVYLGKGSKVERGAIVRGPTIIGENTTIRSNACIRGDVIIGDNSLVGVAVEIRHCLVMDDSRIPHANMMFTSIIGSGVRMAGFVVSANKPMHAEPVSIRLKVRGEQKEYPTHSDLFGFILGDNTQIGASVTAYPGTILEPDCTIFPLCHVSGYVTQGSTIKPKYYGNTVIPGELI